MFNNKLLVVKQLIGFKHYSLNNNLLFCPNCVCFKYVGYSLWLCVLYMVLYTLYILCGFVYPSRPRSYTTVLLYYCISVLLNYWITILLQAIGIYHKWDINYQANYLWTRRALLITDPPPLAPPLCLFFY